MISYSPAYIRSVDEYVMCRIDIYDLPSRDYWCGRHEYGVPLMLREDFRAFSLWLNNLRTDTCWSKHDIFEAFEKHIGHEIRWKK